MKKDMESTPQEARQLIVLLGKNRFALPLSYVKEVIEMTEARRLPQKPAFVEGIIDLRGQILGVYDLTEMLKLGKRNNGPKTAIVILEVNSSEPFGVIVDRVISVQSHESLNIMSLPSTFRDHSTANTEFISGVSGDGDEITLTLSVFSIFDFKEKFGKNIAS